MFAVWLIITVVIVILLVWGLAQCGIEVCCCMIEALFDLVGCMIGALIEVLDKIGND